MRERLGTLLRQGLVHNVFLLSGMQIAMSLFPLITVPYLTRVLGHSSCSLGSIALSFGQYVILQVEYEF